MGADFGMHCSQCERRTKYCDHGIEHYGMIGRKIVFADHSTSYYGIIVKADHGGRRLWIKKEDGYKWLFDRWLCEVNLLEEKE